MRIISSPGAAPAGITIIHNASIADVAAFEIDSELSSIIRRPAVRKSILRNLAAAPNARLTLAVRDGLIIGHSAVGPSFGRWVELPRVREVAFEVSRTWRRAGVATRLSEAANNDPAIEDEILRAFLWPSAWDTEFEGMTRTAYRDRLSAFVSRYGFRQVGTDEPEIALQDGGRLLVRVGARVPCHAVAAFTQARYLNRNRHDIAA